MEEGDPPPPQETSKDRDKRQAQPDEQQLHLESGVVSLPSPQDRSQQPANPSQADLFDDWEQAPRSKRKKMSNSPSPSPPEPVDKDDTEEMTEENCSDSEDEETSSQNQAKPISSKDSSSTNKKTLPTVILHRDFITRKKTENISMISPKCLGGQNSLWSSVMSGEVLLPSKG